MVPLLERRDREEWVVTLQHVLSVMAAQAALGRGRRQRWAWRVERVKAERLERRAMRSYDVVVVCSDEDAGHLE